MNELFTQFHMQVFFSFIHSFIYSFQSVEIKKGILNQPSAEYIKKLKPGEGHVPLTWMKTPEHAELFLRHHYNDYLVACGLYQI